MTKEGREQGKKPGRTKWIIALVGVFIFACFIGIALGGIGASTAGDSEATEVEVTRIVQVAADGGEIAPVEVTRLVEVATEGEAIEVTRLVEVATEVEVTRVVEVMAEPQPMPRAEFFRLAGNGELISENYDFGSCNKAVWYATAAGEDGNFFGYLWDANCTGDDFQCIEDIVEMAPFDSELEGQMLLRMAGGQYYIELTHAPNVGWEIWAECQS